MKKPISILTLCVISQLLFCQFTDTFFDIKGILYNSHFEAVKAAHIININSGHLAISDSLGVFLIKSRLHDSLLIKNITYRDTVIVVNNPIMVYTLMLSEKLHPIEEAKIFPWGSTFDDLKKAFLAMPEEENLQKKLGLPQADPDAIPFYLDEKKISSPAFAIHSPVSFLYYNLSRKEKSRRKLYKIERDRWRTEKFNAVFSRENVSGLTGLKGEALEEFWFYLNRKMKCGINCKELEILQEINEHFEKWSCQGGSSQKDIPEGK